MSQSHSIVAEPLVRATVTTLPPAPALLALARFRYAPKAKFGPAAGPGPVAFVVESGTLLFSAQGPVSVRRTGNGGTQTPPPNQEFAVQPGDEVLIPGDVVHAVRNTGTVPATILGAATFPGGGPPRNFPDGVTFVPLVMNTVSALPPAPAEYAVNRVTLSPGSSDANAYYSGPGLHFVESGALDLQVVSGEVQVMRDLATGKSEIVRVGQQAQLTKGQGAVVPQGSVATIANASARDTVVLTLRTAAAFVPKQTDIKQVLPNFVHTVMDGAKAEAAREFLDVSFFSHDAPPAGLTEADKTDIDSVIGFLNNLIFPSFSRFTTKFPTLIQDGDLVAGHWVQSFQHTGDGYFGAKATGRTVTIDGFTIGRVKDGKIVEHWEQRDAASWHKQIGLGFPLGPLDSPKVTASQDKDIVRGYYDAWNASNKTRVESTLASEFVNHQPIAGQLSGRDGIWQLATALRGALQNFQVTVDLLVGDGSGTVFSRLRYSGIHKGVLFGVPATGRPIEVAAIELFTITDGQITARWGQLDDASLAMQLGVFAPPGSGPAPRT